MTLTAEVSPRQTDRRRARYEARRVLWAESGLDRVKSCGKHGVNPDGNVIIKASGTGPTRAAGFSGLASCGSVWACPWCSAKIAAHRQGEISAAVTAWQARGGGVALVTLTMRHRAGQSLRSLWNGNAYAWGKVTSGRGWKADQAASGVAGWVRVVEVTYGENGWHVHVHALMFLTPGIFAESDAWHLGASMFQRWRDALLRKGFQAPLAGSGGLDAKMLTGDASGLGDYFTKAVYTTAERAGLEIARSDLKGGRRGNRQPFEILRDVVQLGDADDLDTWHEWERASKGRRQMTWSKGFRRQLLPAVVELDDQAVVEQDQGGDVVATVDAALWRRWRHRGWELLLWAEQDDTGEALMHALAYTPPNRDGFRYLL